MSAMNLKTLISFMPSKKYIAYFLGAFLFFLIILFPYNDLVQKVLYKISKSNLPVQILYDSHHFGLFPIKLSFKDVTLTTPKLSQPVHIEKLVIKPNYWNLLSLRPGAQFQIHTKKSEMNVSINKAYSRKKGDDPIHIQVRSQKFNLETLRSVSPFFMQSQGMAKVFVDLTLDLNWTQGPEGSIQIQTTDVEIQPYSFSAQHIGTISTPHLQWKQSDGKFQFKKGDLSIDSFEIATPRAPLYVKSQGVIRMHWSPLSIRLKSYDTKLKMIMDEKIKNQFFFAELFLASTEEKLSKTRYQYNARISGQHPRPPRIQKITD